MSGMKVVHYNKVKITLTMEQRDQLMGHLSERHGTMIATREGYDKFTDLLKIIRNAPHPTTYEMA